MGFIGQAGQQEIKDAVLGAIEHIRKSGQAAGILTLDEEIQRQCKDLGATNSSATAIDVIVFSRNMRQSAVDVRKRLKG